MNYAIETTNLTKFYGKARGITDVTFQVKVGEVFGFLGPNGAGKTTTIRLLLNLLKPTSGQVSIMGLDANSDSFQSKQFCGAVFSEPSFYGKLTGRANLNLLQSYHAQGNKYSQSLADRLAIDLDRPVHSYSRGTRQKLAIVQALSHDPKVLILDEPTSGLDPLIQQEFYKILSELRDAGTSIFLSSHILSEVDRLCDRVGIIKEGSLIELKDIADLRRQQIRRIQVVLDREANTNDFQTEGLEILNLSGRSAELLVSGEIKSLINHLNTLPIENIIFPEASLEDTFNKFYQHSDVEV